MATPINPTDILFARISWRGNTIASLKFSGMSSMPAVFRHLRPVLSGRQGMAVLALRNSSQGWTQQRRVVLDGRPYGNEKPVQLTLF